MKINIAIVGYDSYPIPAIRGGAIEELMTVLLEQNELNPIFEFTVFTIQDACLKDSTAHYKHSSFIQINNTSGYYYYCNLMYKAIRKISGYRLVYKTAYMSQVNKYLETNDFDVVFFATSNYQVFEASSKIKSKILYGVYSDYLTKKSYGIQCVLAKLTSFVSNKYLAGRLIEELGCPVSKVKLLDAAIDTTIIDDMQRQLYRDEIRQKYNINNNDLIVLYCGRLSPEKGALELVKAVNSIPECKLIIVGGSNFSKNEKTDYVRSLLSEADKTNGRVIFTGYIPNHADVKKYMYASDIGVVPSICNEAASSAMMEFRVAGLPTVISRMGGMPIYAGQNVVMVDYDENYVDSLSKAIKELCDNKNLREEKSKLAYQNLDSLSYSTYFNNFKDLIYSLF